MTRLANRDPYLDGLEHVLARMARKKETVAVLFVDLDDFKAVNDGFGHEVAGDRLLVTVSQRFQACLRPGETVARLGGTSSRGCSLARSAAGALRKPRFSAAIEDFLGSGVPVW